MTKNIQCFISIVLIISLIYTTGINIFASENDTPALADVTEETTNKPGSSIRALVDGIGNLNVLGGISDAATSEEAAFISVYDIYKRMLALVDITALDRSDFNISIENMKDAYAIKLLRWKMPGLIPADNATSANVTHMRNYELCEGEVIDKLDSLEGFSQGRYPSGINYSFSVDTQNVKNNSASIKAEINETEGVSQVAAIKLNKKVSLDLSETNKHVTFWMYIPEKYENCRISVYFFSSATENSEYRAYAVKYTNNMYPGWQMVSLGEDDWKYGKSGGAIEDSSFDWSDINLMQINIGNSKKDYDFTCSISDLRIGKEWAPKIIFRFDDGLKGVTEYAFPALKQRGMSGIVYCNTYFNQKADDSKASVDNGGEGIVDPVGNVRYDLKYCTTEELMNAYNDGFDISNHSRSHLVFVGDGVHYGYTDTDNDETKRTSVLYQVKNAQDWLISKGFVKSARYFAVPGGHDTDFCQQALNDCGVLTSGNSISEDFIPTNDIHKMTAWGIGHPDGYDDKGNTWQGDDVSDIQGWITNAVNNGHTIVLMFHDIVDGQYNSNTEKRYQYPKDKFEELLDWIVAQGWSEYVVSMSEWYEGLNRFSPIQYPYEYTE